MKTYKTKPLEVYFKINGEVFPYMTIYKNTNSHKFETVKNYFKVDIFDFKDAIDNFGDLHFWDIQQRYNNILSSVENNMRWILEYIISKGIKGDSDDKVHLLRVDITLRVDNTDKIIRRWFTINKSYFFGLPREVLKYDSKYNELEIMVINEINNLMINDNEKAALLIDTLMGDWESRREGRR